MYDGMINIYKERGYTSHDVVAKLRGILGQKKIGHTGTLDPDAEGVLPVCLGSGTGLSAMITAEDKTYRTVMRLGLITDTQDMTGTVLEERAVNCSADEVRRVIMEAEGEYAQLPPMYSAIKIGGRKLCDIARKGGTVERAPRLVKIYSIDINDIDLPLADMTVKCSKGTYIRTLCHDIGQRLGCGACMQSLVRTQTGMFVIDDAVRLSEVEALKKEAPGRLEEHIIPVDRMLSCFPSVVSRDPDTDRILVNGGKIPAAGFEAAAETMPDGCKLRAYDSSGRFIAVYTYCADGDYYKNYKMFCINRQ